MIASLSELAKRKFEITDFTVDGHCSGCCACCSDFLPMSKAEIERIRAYVRKHHLKEHTTVVNPGVYVDGTCPFRNNVARKCDIYPVRPEICRCFQCDQARDDIDQNKALFYHEKLSISMRAEFFGNVQNGIMARMIGAALGLKYQEQSKS